MNGVQIERNNKVANNFTSSIACSVLNKFKCFLLKVKGNLYTFLQFAEAKLNEVLLYLLGYFIIKKKDRRTCPSFAISMNEKYL